MEQRELDDLVLRSRRLAFGIFAMVPAVTGRYVRFGGSGLLTSPFSGLSARHVNLELHKLDWRGGDPKRGLKKESFGTDYSAYAFQKLDSASQRYSLWQVDKTFLTSLTDIGLIYVSAHDGEAANLATEKLPFFEWQMLPPPKGSEVVMLGYPGSEVTVGEGNKILIKAKLVWETAHVVEIYMDKRDKNMINFPCFTLDKQIDHGFSGGPVFWQNKLCGMVSSDAVLEHGTYAAQLWPLALMEKEYPKDRGLAPPTVAELLEKRIISSPDWRSIMSLISARPDPDDGKHYPHISLS